MNAKELFLKDDAAVKFMLGVTKSPLFDKACLYAKQEWQDRYTTKPGLVTAESIAAISMFLDTMRDLPLDEIKPSPMPSPHLNHDLEVPERKLKPKAAKKKE
jgi:hypothetical protein